jgi:hypothetical protein
MQGAQNKDLQWKKKQPPKCMGLKTKTSDEKRGNLQNVRGSKQRPPMNKRGNPPKCKGVQNKDFR